MRISAKNAGIIRDGLYLAEHDIHNDRIRLYNHVDQLKFFSDTYGEKSLLNRAYRRAVMKYVRKLHQRRVEISLMVNREIDKNMKRYMEGGY